MKKFYLLPLFFLLLLVTFGQIPTNYYSDAEGKTGTELKIAMFNIIKNHNSISYGSLWTAFESTDKKANNKVWDMYSDIPGNPPYEYTFFSNQCGNYSKEGDCYNREHSIPASWFNDAAPMYTDLFHLYPTDGYVNNRRNNDPFGETNTNNATWTSKNGSKLGKSIFPGFTGTVFEPIDEYKGDFARTYFYMTTRYYNNNLSQVSEGKVVFTYTNSKTELTDYAINLFLKWHRDDPVSEKETNRNNAVYGIQHNRNPFIDYPELAEYIWGNHQNEAWYSTQGVSEKVFPTIKITRSFNGIHIEGAQPNARVEIYSVLGQNVYTTRTSSDFLSLEHLKQGFYIVKVEGCVQKMVW